ncbi:PTS system mannose/fructose/N-acetylgalactosamine-transporter subunit IIB [Maledivibacter halophilus]|uniref:PTS system, mannose-specific IIB component n=1 Tax=Maledivibacter halophilus TaxID=36842 RepID=A0A1T5IDY2_9FIRM|nr:PTS sugar transporter subunit IIB [Maledivibacter halophilus]SKC37280.1 PTS system, mannose-specific IIB component [Maledivibacter halophilus]
MTISLVRIDDRVIHGQVLTQWTRIYPCNGIIVVNDKLAVNKALGQVYKSAAPEGIKVFIFTVEKTLAKLEEAKRSAKNYFLISKSPIELSQLTENNADFGKYIVYGPSSYRKKTITIGPNQSLLKEEMDACEALHNCGIDIDFKLTPDKKGFKWSDVRKKYY